MATNFVLKPVEIRMSDGRFFNFWFDGNSKVTVGNGSFDEPVANSFSLVQVQDCPFATPICASICYVHKLEEAEAAVHQKYHQNSANIREVLKNPGYTIETENVFAEIIKHNCRQGFRWHVSGDVFSQEYAYFIRNVCLKFQPIFSWIYTRSFPFITPPHV